ncbi:MAG: ABC transporter ATP-binding protein [Burkholderiaceae bacterium]
MNPPSSSEVLLRVCNLNVTFQIGKQAPRLAVRNVSFEVPANRVVALVGESGSGKSVSALSILRLLPANADVTGAIFYEGRDLLSLSGAQMRELRGSAISIVFQEPMSSLNPVYSIGEQISEVLRAHGAQSRKGARLRTLELLEEVGIPDAAQRANSYPHELSGGQQQRAMIAMALACNPRLLIADEPTTALDVTIQRQILELLARLRKSHQLSVLFITHDLGLVAEIADDVVVMQNGEVRECGAVSQIFASPRDPYTRALLACRPSLDARPLRLPVVADFLSAVPPPPSLAERPARPQGDLVLEVTGLTKQFRLRDGPFRSRHVFAARDVSFGLAKGRTLGVVGESGSGKTTVGLTLIGLHRADAGRAVLHADGQGHDLLALDEAGMLPFRKRIQIVFQNPYASLNPRFTVGHILTEPMKIHAIGEDGAARHRLALQLLDRVGLARDALRRYPHEFSGGQRQRIAIARCLTMKPDVMICDESVSALDVSVQATILNLLLDLQDEYHMAYIFISHDLAVVRYMADEVMVMNQGEAVELADAEQIYRNPQHPYTRRLLDSSTTARIAVLP